MILVKIYVIAFVVVVIASMIDSAGNKQRKRNAKGGYFAPRKIVSSGTGSYSSAGGGYSTGGYSGGGYQSEDPEPTYSAGTEYNMGYDNGSSGSYDSGYTQSQEMAAYDAGYWGAEDFEQTTGMNIDDIMV